MTLELVPLALSCGCVIDGDTPPNEGDDPIRDALGFRGTKFRWTAGRDSSQVECPNGHGWQTWIAEPPLDP